MTILLTVGNPSVFRVIALVGYAGIRTLRRSWGVTIQFRALADFTGSGPLRWRWGGTIQFIVLSVCAVTESHRRSWRVILISALWRSMLVSKRPGGAGDGFGWQKV